MSGSGPETRRVDWRQAATLLGVYLRLSLRRSSRGFATLASRSRVPGPAQALAFYVVFGLLMGTVAFAGLDVFTYALFVLGTSLFAIMSATSFVAADVLLNPEEGEVLDFRPISPATLLAAKAANLAVFGLGIAAATNALPMFFGLAARGARPWFPLVHALAALLLALFCTGAVVLLYGLLMRFVPRRHFVRAATLGQIALPLGVVATTQLLPRATPETTLSLRRAWAWLALVPVTWFAALDEALAGPGGDRGLLGLALAGGLVTAGVFALAVTRLAPAFRESLSGLAERPALAHPRRAAARGRSAGLEAALRLWIRDPVERGAFLLAGAYLRRDREIMMRLWPGVAVIVLLPPLSLIGREPDVSQFLVLASLGLSMTPPVALEILESSAHWGAAEVFRIAPLPDAMPLFHGVRKAVLGGIVLPVAALLAGIGLLATRGDWRVLPALLPALLLAPPASLLPAALRTYVPLSQPSRRGMQETRGLALVLTALLVLFPIALAARWAEHRGRLAPFLAAELALAVGLHVALLWLARRRARILPAEE